MHMGRYCGVCLNGRASGLYPDGWGFKSLHHNKNVWILNLFKLPLRKFIIMVKVLNIEYSNITPTAPTYNAMAVFNKKDAEIAFELLAFALYKTVTMLYQTK